jgi:hypothetical protein
MAYQGVVFFAFLAITIYKACPEFLYDHNQYDAVFTSLIDYFLVSSGQVKSFLINARGVSVPAVGTHYYKGYFYVRGVRTAYRATFIKNKETVGDREVESYDVKVNSYWYNSEQVFRNLKSSFCALENNTVEILHISTASYKMDVRSLQLRYHTPKQHQRQVADNTIERFVEKGNVCILLHGPPGTGKTTTAHVVKKLLDSKLNKKTQLYHNFDPSTSVDVATILESAKHAPTIIVIDEIDGHFKTALSNDRGINVNPRSTSVDGKQAFNGMLDLIKGTYNVILIATSNEDASGLESTYTAFMRRFDDCVYMDRMTEQ